jgi:ribosome-associated translation inhibitor RaiA
MAINVKASGLTLNGIQRDYLDKRLESLGKLVDLNDDAVICDVELGRTTEHHQTGDIFYAEINLTHEGKLSRATATAATLQEAIDTTKDELLEVLRKDKGRQEHRRRRASSAIKAFIQGGPWRRFSRRFNMKFRKSEYRAFEDEGTEN